jgi:hypothetical protein
VEQQDRVLVPAVDQLTPAVLHQQGVAVVDGIAQLNKGCQIFHGTKYQKVKKTATEYTKWP